MSVRSVSKKVCLLGAHSVGKTSLVRRYVMSIFDEKYLTTVGVKVDKKVVEVAGHEVTLVIWDLAGEDEYNIVKSSHLRGASGYILVVDGTRRRSLDTVVDLHARAVEALGNVPVILAINKSDLSDEWQISEDEARAALASIPCFRTSALDGSNVEALFTTLAQAMV